ncbi:MAG TPA: ergothioneine biosynthesis protein EgtB [Steroidobacter sp.]
MTVVQTAAPSLTARTSQSLVSSYRRVRGVSLEICDGLEPEDFVVQSMTDASPLKWHLAHTSWFFEQFLLKSCLSAYRPFHPRYEYLFNSYYQSVGPMHQRPKRGMLTRPTVHEIMRYRQYVDEHMETLLEERGEEEKIVSLTTLGLNHEQQHQELMLTDLKHLFSLNPLWPAYRPYRAAPRGTTTPMQFHSFEGGVREIGASGQQFCFDNELPRHRTFVGPYALADRLVTNGEFLEFIRDDGYRRPELWLSDGWDTVGREGWKKPLYWSESLDSEFTLSGEQTLDPAAPVSHLSYYEADAFARWAGARLPTEAEWELAAASLPITGNLYESGLLRAAPATSQPGMKQMFGDLWEWTASPYTPYPGYRPAPGALGEYNGKFMCNQLVLRGGSCATAGDHIRASYRNFFYPHARWQFMGVRLARDL